MQNNDVGEVSVGGENGLKFKGPANGMYKLTGGIAAACLAMSVALNVWIVPRYFNNKEASIERKLSDRDETMNNLLNKLDLVQTDLRGIELKLAEMHSVYLTREEARRVALDVINSAVPGLIDAALNRYQRTHDSDNKDK